MGTDSGVLVDLQHPGLANQESPQSVHVVRASPKRWARPGQATPASLSEYIASAYERPVRPDRSDESGPGTSSNHQRPRTGVGLTGGAR
jgi:hypothetical protein